MAGGAANYLFCLGFRSGALRFFCQPFSPSGRVYLSAQLGASEPRLWKSRLAAPAHRIRVQSTQTRFYTRSARLTSNQERFTIRDT